MLEAESHRALEALLRRKQRGSVRGASDRAKKLMKNEIHPLPLVFEMVQALMETHDYELARRLLENNQNPSHPRWVSQWLNLKWRTEFAPSIIDLEREFMEQFCHLKWVKVRYLNKLISLKDFEAAKKFVGAEGLTNSPKAYFQLRYLLVLALGWTAEVARCVAVAFDKDQWLFSDQEQVGVAAQFMHHFLGDSGQHFPPEIDDFLETCSIEGNLQITRLRLKRAVHRGCWPTVQTILKNYPEFSENPMFVHASTWLASVLGDTSRARSIFRRRSHLLVNKPLRPCRTGELVKIDGKSLSDHPAIRLFTVVRNEVARIPWFLDFYRGLGVNRFFFVDNGSTDGTREVLLSQPDVHVFYTDTKYSEGAAGMVWVNDLVDRFGGNGWNLYVDVDEALVFPNSERDGLNFLTQYMERNGQEALPAFMLDMHANRGFGHPASGLIERDFVEAYPFYYADFTIEADFAAPYYEATGGGRYHLFRDRTNQTKTPLIRGGQGHQVSWKQP